MLLHPTHIRENKEEKIEKIYTAILILKSIAFKFFPISVHFIHSHNPGYSLSQIQKRRRGGVDIFIYAEPTRRPLRGMCTAKLTG
jgi:hypothetical protein